MTSWAKFLPVSVLESNDIAEMNRKRALVIVCGLLPLVMVHYAYWLNIHAPDTLAAAYQCNPYFEGCVSVSRAVRSGPGLIVFKAVMLPLAIFLMLSWRFIGAWMAQLEPGMEGTRRWTVRLGVMGAIALVFYVVFLGTEGDVYRWLRRYGVVFFFGFSALAQLIAAKLVWDRFDDFRGAFAALFVALVSFQWVIGVFSVFKKLVFDDPQLIDRIQNITEWLMIVLMSLGLALIGVLMQSRLPERPEPY